MNCGRNQRSQAYQGFQANTIILYGYKTIGAASYPLSIYDAKHPLTILKGIHTTDEKMTNTFAG
ncbi:TPA: hypothetical protein IDY48_004766 [Escherichia coli]|nr:hypothetical protein [Escherichia coli]EGT7915919.1 hypothetical protein [Escherichia coli]EIU8039578.1 hypothetical protein [Escherichia coli]EIW6265480.1 hypothetical protein [Escherichia coli]EJR7609104.1 hypothetical protein [Escherichia coli]